MAVATPRAMLADISSVLAVPSFVIVVTQGIVGSTPWNALVFNTLYLQLLGFSDFQSSLVAALFLGGTAFGAQARSRPRHAACAPSPPACFTRAAAGTRRGQTCLSDCCSHCHAAGWPETRQPLPLLPMPCVQLGGFIGDWAARRHPSHGRVAVAQVSVGLGVPLSIAVFKVGCPRVVWCACGMAGQGAPLNACPAASAAASPHHPVHAHPCPQLLPMGSSGGIVALYGVAFTIWGLMIRWAARGAAQHGSSMHNKLACIEWGLPG